MSIASPDIAADPNAIDPRDRGGPLQPMLIARDLRKHFPVKRSGGKAVRAVDGVSFMVRKGETLGIVGESGCGKSTLARLLLHLIVPDNGELVFDGDTVARPQGIDVGALRRHGPRSTISIASRAIKGAAAPILRARSGFDALPSSERL